MSSLHPAVEAVDRALQLLPDAPEFQPVRTGLLQAGEALRNRLRIAVVGGPGSGKSTLVGALLGCPVPTAANLRSRPAVCVLRHAEAGFARVLFTDGRPPLECAPAEVSDCLGNGAGVDRVEISGTYPFLKTFDLVDTPGIGTDDAMDAAVLRVLGVQDAAPAGRIRRADAVLAVLNTAVARRDAELLLRFRGYPDGSLPLTPITTVGALTKVESLWPAGTAEPCDDALVPGRDHARRIRADRATRGLLHDVVPVCGRLAAGAAVLSEAAFEDLSTLAAVPEKGLRTRLEDRSTFDTRPVADLPLPPSRRAFLAELLSPYGVFRAVRFLREGVATRDELREQLEAVSGLPDLRLLLLEHFGHRGDLIRTGRIVDWAHEVRRRPLSADRRVSSRVADALRPVTALGADDPSFAEMRLLRQWYEGRLDVCDEYAAELERAAGERGVSVARRLGCGDQDPPRLLERTALEQVSRWRRVQTTGGPGPRLLAAVLERRYEQLYERVRQARLLLGEEDE